MSNRDKEALDAYSETVISVAKQIGPAVVRIDTDRPPRIVGPFYERGGSGLGSGFIFQSDGSILTNAHVIADAARRQVTLFDGKKLPADLVYAEPAEDLAVLRVNSDQPLPVAEISADQLQPGQLVIAIGNPFGLGWSVTAGIVSAVGRRQETSEEGAVLKNLIQTQTPINPGNSGGPLANSLGKVVGITTAIVPYGQNIGFAIPADTIYNFLTRAHSKGGRTASHGVALGVSVVSMPLDPFLIQTNRLRQRMGVTIMDVTPNTPAAEGGLKPQDIILAADGTVVQDSRELAILVQRHKPGDKMVINFVRDYKIRQVTVVF